MLVLKMGLDELGLVCRTLFVAGVLLAVSLLELASRGCRSQGGKKSSSCDKISLPPSEWPFFPVSGLLTRKLVVVADCHLPVRKEHADFGF